MITSAETFTRLTLTGPDGTEEKVALSVDWRAHDSVQLALGPVPPADDALANPARSAYRTDSNILADMRRRFARWRRELLAADSR